MEQIEQSEEKLVANLTATKIGLISELMVKGEQALIEDDNALLRFKCWQSVSILIDNQLSPERKKKLKTLEKKVIKESYKKNEYVNQQWERGSSSWYENQFILNKSKMLFYSNVYIKYLNFLLKKIGLDIQSREY